MKIKDVDDNIGVPITIKDYLGGTSQTGTIITIISRKRSLVSFKYTDNESRGIGLIHRHDIVSFSRV